MRYREIVAVEGASEGGIIKPIKPLNPVQQQKKQERNVATQKRIRDEEGASARKVADLRAKLT